MTELRFIGRALRRRAQSRSPQPKPTRRPASATDRDDDSALGVDRRAARPGARRCPANPAVMPKRIPVRAGRSAAPCRRAGRWQRASGCDCVAQELLARTGLAPDSGDDPENGFIVVFMAWPAHTREDTMRRTAKNVGMNT